MAENRRFRLKGSSAVLMGLVLALVECGRIWHSMPGSQEFASSELFMARTVTLALFFIAGLVIACGGQFLFWKFTSHLTVQGAERVSSILVLIGSSLFVLAGVWATFLGKVGLGISSILFFGIGVAWAIRALAKERGFKSP